MLAIMSFSQYNLISDDFHIPDIFSYQFKKIMGLLSDLGPIEDFEETRKQQKMLKVIGVKQFLFRLKRYAKWMKTTDLGHIKWGEQIEGHFLKLNSENELELCKEDISEEYKDLKFPLMFQYGSWMFEMIPSEPYNTNCNFYEIINSIRKKYIALSNRPRIALTIPVIPLLGVRKPGQLINNQISQSQYIDDNHIASHPRFKTLTKHVRMRRGQTVNINVPIYQDTNTSQQELKQTQPNPQFIHMDAMAFGMGNSCLQCTFSTKDFDHARYVYDQFNTLSPILLALTAGSPFFKGKVSDWDVRWKVISDSCDDRTPEERDQKNENYIPTSRYNESNYYLWDNPVNKEQYNDFYTGVKEEDVAAIKKIAEQQQVYIDDKLANHIANIFKRDYLIVHKKFKQMPIQEYILFEMLNGTNWNSVRLKIPIDDDIGWRVQFRTMQVQLTADQNSAYSLLIHLITRVLHERSDLNLYIPISKLRQNFNRAHKRNAVLAQKFYFRTNIYDKGLPVIEELTVKQILFGKGQFKGIFIEIEERVDCGKICPSVNQLIGCLKRFIHDTASGVRKTLAQWMRDYVNNHPQYKHNSILGKKVMDDLLITLHKISTGVIKDQNFQTIFPNILCEKEKFCDFKVGTKAVLVKQ